nr:hypothetical protein [Candidatus Sigynarchaeota archaeon]
RHFITHEVTQIVFASGCSIEIHDEAVTPLIKAGLNAKRKIYKDDKWSEPESAAGNPIIVVKKHGQGKVVACGNFSIITSLSKTYGLFAANNFTLIGNIFAWLSNKKAGDEAGGSDLIHMNVAIDPDIYYWIEGEIKDKQRFENVNELINFALNAVKQSLDTLEVGSPGAEEEETEPEEISAPVETVGTDPSSVAEGAKTQEQPKIVEKTAPSPAPVKPATTEAPAASIKPETPKPGQGPQQPGEQKPAGQKPGQQKPLSKKPLEKGQKLQQGKKYGSKGYRPPDRNLVFKAKPEALKTIKKQKPAEEKPAEKKD